MEIYQNITTDIYSLNRMKSAYGCTTISGAPDYSAILMELPRTNVATPAGAEAVSAYGLLQTADRKDAGLLVILVWKSIDEFFCKAPAVAYSPFEILYRNTAASPMDLPPVEEDSEEIPMDEHTRKALDWECAAEEYFLLTRKSEVAPELVDFVMVTQADREGKFNYQSGTLNMMEVCKDEAALSAAFIRNYYNDYAHFALCNADESDEDKFNFIGEDEIDPETSKIPPISDYYYELAKLVLMNKGKPYDKASCETVDAETAQMRIFTTTGHTIVPEEIIQKPTVEMVNTWANWARDIILTLDCGGYGNLITDASEARARKELVSKIQDACEKLDLDPEDYL